MNLENDILIKYWKTLSRKNVSNIPTNKFIKKPYLENYIIKLSTTIDNDELNKKILYFIENEKITNDELFLFLSNNINLEHDEKKNIENYFNNNNFNNKDFVKLSHEIVFYQIKYFRFYQTITELLFDSNSENNELYNFILIYIKNKKLELNNYKKKNVKFNIFYHYIKDLEEQYNNIFKLLIEFNLYNNDDFDNKNINNLFLKNLFINWYNIYKNDISENRVNDKIKDYILTKGLLSKILCLPNI